MNLLEMTKEEITAELGRSIQDALKEAQRLIALNTPMGFKDSPPSPFDAVGDEMDKARDHIRKALVLVREAMKPS